MLNYIVIALLVALVMPRIMKLIIRKKYIDKNITLNINELKIFLLVNKKYKEEFYHILTPFRGLIQSDIKVGENIKIGVRKRNIIEIEQLYLKMELEQLKLEEYDEFKNILFKLIDDINFKLNIRKYIIDRIKLNLMLVTYIIRLALKNKLEISSIKKQKILMMKMQMILLQDYLFQLKV